MNLGDTIANLREVRGLKQKELAKRVGITQAYLSQIENNKKEPNFSKLKIIGEVLDVPVPLIFFLAMDEQDVSNQKKDAFVMLRPIMKNLINDYFISPTETQP